MPTSNIHLRDVLRMLNVHGFAEARRRGTHVVYQHATAGVHVRVSHGHRDMDKNEVKAVENAIFDATGERVRVRDFNK